MRCDAMKKKCKHIEGKTTLEQCSEKNTTNNRIYESKKTWISIVIAQHIHWKYIHDLFANA